jgi:hypothetical protein
MARRQQHVDHAKRNLQDDAQHDSGHLLLVPQFDGAQQVTIYSSCILNHIPRLMA